jgi:hypothetical protein
VTDHCTRISLKIKLEPFIRHCYKATPEWILNNSISSHPAILTIYTAKNAVSPSMMVPPRSLKRRREDERKSHAWTEKELNLLAHLKYLHHWYYKQIQTAHFPSLSVGALCRAYWRLSPDERVRRALIIPPSLHTQPICSTLKHEPCHLYPSISGSEIILSASSEDRPIILNHSNKNRYNLRPNRPTAFPRRASQYRLRFPHFFKSYKDHLKYGLPDQDYNPPSRTPTPEPSDRSPSVVSTQLSSASSLELFGLEPRSPRLLSLEPSTISNLSSNVASPEFLSAEEHISSP